MVSEQFGPPGPSNALHRRPELEMPTPHGRTQVLKRPFRETFKLQAHRSSAARKPMLVWQAQNPAGSASKAPPAPPQCARCCRSEPRTRPQAARWKGLQGCRAKPPGSRAGGAPLHPGSSRQTQWGTSQLQPLSGPEHTCTSGARGFGLPGVPTHLKTAQISDRQRAWCARPAG